MFEPGVQDLKKLNKIHPNLISQSQQLFESILDETKSPARSLKSLFKNNKKWGSRDRRFVAASVYDLLRWKELLISFSEERESLMEAYLRWCDLADHKRVEFSESQAESVQHSYPEWLYEKGKSYFGDQWSAEAKVLNKVAPAYLRVNFLKSSQVEVERFLENHEVGYRYHDKGCFELLDRFQFFKLEAYLSGLFEVQDRSSQLVAPFCNVKPGMRFIDACAGAGGKSLHVSDLMNNKGQIISLDLEDWKLRELKKRARKLGCSNIEGRVIESQKTIKRLAKSADRVLLDVPCSGVGVIRRHPETKWFLTEEKIKSLKELQKDLLSRYSNMVKIGGNLIYSTCSFFEDENQQQIQSFLKGNESWEMEDEKTILPSQKIGDGFYMCRMKRIK